MAMLEAMACGLPIIATTVGAIPEAVTDGKEGFLVAPGDINALTERMVRLGTDARLRLEMGQNARDRAARDFSLNRMCDGLLKLYLGILRESRETGSGQGGV